MISFFFYHSDQSSKTVNVNATVFIFISDAQSKNYEQIIVLLNKSIPIPLNFI
mgnify:CR=1 FL=1